MSKQALKELVGFEIVREGSVRRIMLSSKAMKEFDRTMAGTDQKSVGQRRTFERLFERYCSTSAPNNNDQQFKKEGNFGAAKVPVWAFKAFQFRLYGSSISYEGKETFFGVQVDSSKKQNRADRKLLEAAADEIAVIRAAVERSKVSSTGKRK